MGAIDNGTKYHRSKRFDMSWGRNEKELKHWKVVKVVKNGCHLAIGLTWSCLLDDNKDG